MGNVGYSFFSFFFFKTWPPPGKKSGYQTLVACILTTFIKSVLQRYRSACNTKTQSKTTDLLETLMAQILFFFFLELSQLKWVLFECSDQLWIRKHARVWVKSLWVLSHCPTVRLLWMTSPLQSVSLLLHVHTLEMSWQTETKTESVCSHCLSYCTVSLMAST